MAIHKKYFLAEEMKEEMNNYTYETFIGALKEWFESKEEFDCFDFAIGSATTDNSILWFRHKKQVPKLAMFELSQNIAVPSFLCASSLGKTVRVTLYADVNNLRTEVPFKEFVITISRNDYDECMLTFSNIAGTKISSIVFAETTNGNFESLGSAKTASGLYYSYNGVNYSSKATNGIISTGDENKYLIPYFNDYYIFKRGYYAINCHQNTNTVYELGNKKFVEMSMVSNATFALLYEE